jgi:erythritol transport system substrate-binding protein
VFRLASKFCSLLLPLLLLAGCHRGSRHKAPLFEIIVPSEDNPFFKSEADAAAARARQYGYRVRVYSHEGDAYEQDKLVDVAIASNAAVLLLDNAGADASVSAVRRAAKAGIVCILMDREINAQGIAKAQIIADNDQGARLVAAYFARLLNGHGNYAELLGKESDTNAQIRTHGFHAVLDRIPGMKLVEAQSANWDQAQAFEKTEVILEAHGNLNGIIAGNDTMAVGAAAAVKASGRHNITIVGFDGSPDALASIRDGEMEATVLQPAVKIARLAVDEARQYLLTKSTGLPEYQTIPCELVTRANVDDFRNFERIRLSAEASPPAEAALSAEPRSSAKPNNQP